MALMFQRLAYNYLKNGYYPTDSVTLSRILGSLTTQFDTQSHTIRVYDPCCGEGTALAEVKHHLAQCIGQSSASDAVIESYGVEINEARAAHAMQLLDRVAHSDIVDVMLTQRSMSLLFLNPPYGQAVSDSSPLGLTQTGMDRLEYRYIQQVLPSLQLGGVMVLIVPHYSMNSRLSDLLARHFTAIQCFLAPEQQFKQLVIFAVKQRVTHAVPAVKEALQQIGEGHLPPDLPEGGVAQPYVIPAANPMQVQFIAQAMTALQLSMQLMKQRGLTLWAGLSQQFGQQHLTQRRPLRALTDWHLALALAAGQIGGVVTSRDGRRLLIKGATHKDKVTTSQFEEDEDGTVRETRVAIDRFVPVINALDVTVGRPSFGQRIVIR